MSRYYVGLDVRQAGISIAVLDQEGKLAVESVVETGAATVLTFLGRLRGHVEVTFEEGTHAAWLYDVLRAARVKALVCDPRKNKLLLLEGSGPSICRFRGPPSEASPCCNAMPPRMTRESDR